jgi:hypothetical protein
MNHIYFSNFSSDVQSEYRYIYHNAHYHSQILARVYALNLETDILLEKKERRFSYHFDYDYD